MKLLGARGPRGQLSVPGRHTTASCAWRLVGRLYLWAADRLYQELAFLYDPVSWAVSRGRWTRWRRIALDYVTGSQLLEIGFGTGELLLELSARDHKVYGIEPSPAMQRIAAAKLRKRKLRVDRLRARAQALPLSDDCFHTIISTFPAPYIMEPATLREIRRVLSQIPIDPGDPPGRLVVVGLVVYQGRPEVTLECRLESPLEPAVERFRNAAAAAGLATRCISRFDPPARLPVLIAECA